MKCTIPTQAALSLLGLSSLCRGHSWVEQVSLVSQDGIWLGAPGYSRENGTLSQKTSQAAKSWAERVVLRTAPGFSDAQMTNLIPPLDRVDQIIHPSDNICMQSQETYNQALGSPMLEASAGSWIVLRYQENGHVTIRSPDPRAVPGKLTPGVVSVYGTTQPSSDSKLQAIHNVRTADGNGGDGRGRLLARSSFDDGVCYQINNTTESQRRQSLPQPKHDDFEGQNLWCGIEVKIPDDAVAGSVQTLYWVWDWPTAPGTARVPPGGKPEICTTCVDVKVV